MRPYDFNFILSAAMTVMNIANRVVNKVGAMPFLPDPNSAMEHDCYRVIKTKSFKLRDSLLTHAS